MSSATYTPADRIEIVSPHAELDRLEQLADLLDSRFTFPGTNFRFGLDAVIGLIPGLGDILSMAISLYLIKRASALGLSRWVKARMFANVMLDTAIGAVPFVGDLFDAGFKANRRNIRLARRALGLQN